MSEKIIDISKNKSNNPFLGRNDGVVIPGYGFDKAYYAEVIQIEKVKKTGEGDEDFVVSKELMVQNKVPLQDYIAQFADDVGILNILKKVAKTGDVNVLQSLKDNGKPGLDLTVMPKDYVEAAEMKQKADAMYDNLPLDVKEKFSKEALLTVTQGAISAYFATLMENNKNVPKEKEVDK